MHTVNFNSNVYTQNSARELKKEAQNARITLKTIEGLTYECSDGVLLKELNSKLQHVMEEFRSKLPIADGLVIRSSIKERVKWTEKRTHSISSLPTYKPRGRKKADSAYRNRVGKRADALRKVSCTQLILPCHNSFTHINMYMYMYIITWECVSNHYIYTHTK